MELLYPSRHPYRFKAIGQTFSCMHPTFVISVIKQLARPDNSCWLLSTIAYCTERKRKREATFIHAIPSVSLSKIPWSTHCSIALSCMHPTPLSCMHPTPLSCMHPTPLSCMHLTSLSYMHSTSLPCMHPTSLSCMHPTQHVLPLF